MRINQLILAVAVSLGLLASAQAQTDNYPNKPIRLVVAYPPGGAADKLARPIGDRLAKALARALSWITGPVAGQPSVPNTPRVSPPMVIPFISPIRALSRSCLACASSTTTASRTLRHWP